MPSNRYPIIAREGWLFILIVILLGLILLYVLYPAAAISVWALLVPMVYFFRDPHRVIPASPTAIVSPVEGVVDSVKTVTDHWLDRDAIRVRIRMGYNNTYSIRSPIEGNILNCWSSEPATLGSKDRIHRHSFWVQSDEGDDVLTAIYLGKVTARLHSYIHPGERVGQGQRCGYFIFGGVVEVYFPVNSKIRVKQGEMVQSGSSILGQLVQKRSSSTIGNPLTA